LSNTLFEKGYLNMGKGMSTGDPIRIGIVGCGAVTQKYHLPSAKKIKSCDVTILVDSDRSRAEQLAAKYNVPTVSTDFRDLPRYADAAIVAVPHRLHASIGEYLLSAGCHVLMEKPLALTDAECRRLITFAKKKNVVLTVGLLRRYFQAQQIAKKLIEANTLGKIKSFNIREGNIYNWPVASDFMFRAGESGGGVLVDTGAHTLDFVLWCLGDFASVEYYDDNLGGVEAECILHLQMKSGARGVVELSRLRNLRNTAIISGENGQIEVHMRADKILFHPGSEQSYQTFEDLPQLTHTMARKWPDCFPAQIESWLNAISGKSPNFITGEEGRKSVALIETCYRQRQRMHPIIGMDDPAGRPTTPSPLKDKVVLVTGATGSIGGRLVEKLVIEHQAQVSVLVRNLSNLSRVSRLPVSVYQGDITDFDAVNKAVEGCEFVFHCAYAFGTSPAEQERVAVVGSRNVARAVLEHKVRSMVYVSTISVYEPMADGDLDEMAPKKPSGWTYPDTKKKAEKVMLEFHGQHALPVVIVQPTIVYGPFVKGWTQGPVNQLKSGTVVLPDDGSGLCNAVYIDDVADSLILAAMTPNAIGETFLISDTEPVTWREFYSAYEKMLGVTATRYMSASEIQARYNKRNNRLRGTITGTLKWLVTRSPSPVVSAGKRLKERSPFVTRILQRYGVISDGGSGGPREFIPDPQRLALFQSKTRVRIDRAREVLGYEPHFDLQNGMELTGRYVQWLNPEG
jgi:predicted dehydrogenase/nucleoside-diphosphate-sugar epimerase